MLKRVLIATALLMSIPIGVGFFLPREYSAEARRSMAGITAEQLYPQVADLRLWEEWTIWSKKEDPDCEWTYEGEPGEGMRMDFNGPRLGTGSVAITKADPKEGIEFDTSIPGEEPVRGRITWREVDGGLDVTWWSQATVRSDPINRWAGFLMFSPAMQSWHEANLQKLEEFAKKAPAKTTPKKGEQLDGGKGEGEVPGEGR